MRQLVNSSTIQITGRSRSKEMRSTAEKSQDHKAKVIMTGTADAYDKMARED